MAINSISDLYAALERGDFNAIIGTPESQGLDFKGQPYGIDSADPQAQNNQKLELAKDVTAIANAGGGVLVLGYKTQRQSNVVQDVAISCSPILQSLINTASYCDLVENRTYPPIRNLTLKWWATGHDHGILTIEVPGVGEADWPVLVTGVSEAGSRRGLLFGLFERSGDQAKSLLVAQVHSDLRIGRLVQRLGMPLERLSAPTAAGPSEQDRSERLRADTEDGELAGRRRYYLQAWPLKSTEIRGLHSQEPGGVQWLLRHAKRARGFGFWLRIAEQPSLISGGGIRVLDQRTVLSLQPNALLTWIAPADSVFLAWGDERRDPKHSINPLALVESTLEFARTYTDIVLPHCEPAVDVWALGGGLADLQQDSEPSKLAPGPFENFFPMYGWREPADAAFSVGPYQFTTESPGAVAYRVLRDIYTHFGIPEQDIPYTREQEVRDGLIGRL